MTESQKEKEVRAWHLLLEDDNYRLDLPDDFYQTLISRADELVLREVIDLAEWQQLKDAAEAVYEKTLQGLSACQRDCVDTVSIDLGIGTTNKPASQL